VAKKQDWKKVGEIVAKVRELGLSYKDGAKRFGVKPWLLYDYKRKGKGNRDASEASVSAKAERAKDEVSKDAATGAAALPGDVGELIRTYRQAHPDHGFKRIQDLLKQKHLVIVTRKQIRKVLKEAGLLEVCDSSFDREEGPAKGTRRFEAAYAGEMWQMDVTYVYICRIPVLYLVVIIDDHSRYCIAGELVRDQRAETLIGVLHNAVTVHGAPRKLLTDQGSGFYSWSREQTRFQEYLDDQKIEHIVAEPHSPQTQGKVERLIQTIREELLSRVKFTGFEDAQGQIRSYVQSYNVDRPHQGIGGSRPADRFHGVAGEVERVEAQLAGREMDLDRGYVIYKVQEHRVCVCSRAQGLQVYLDGKLLKEADGDGSKR
jgi:transposase InsO family protein